MWWGTLSYTILLHYCYLHFLSIFVYSKPFIWSYWCDASLRYSNILTKNTCDLLIRYNGQQTKIWLNEWHSIITTFNDILQYTNSNTDNGWTSLPLEELARAKVFYYILQENLAWFAPHHFSWGSQYQVSRRLQYKTPPLPNELILESQDRQWDCQHIYQNIAPRFDIKQTSTNGKVSNQRTKNLFLALLHSNDQLVPKKATAFNRCFQVALSWTWS